MHIEQRLEFLDSLPTLEVPATPSMQPFSVHTPIDPNKESGTVGPEMMNIYMAGVSEQNRKDVDNCKLLVQNAATQRYDPIKELHQWYKYYIDTLATLGWVTQASQVKDQTIKRSGLTMDIVAAYVLQGLVGANAPKLLELASKAVDGVKNNQGLIDIYNRKANIGSDAKFDMSPVWQTKEGSPMMVLNCNTLNVRESSRGVLFWKSTSQETRIKTAAQAVYLNLGVYDQVRDGVLRKLGQAAKSAIDDIPGFQ
ncbi:hypothetical protein D3C85_860980 [compost metagenome]|uniref:Uncharacterized protein n=1 Tax=Pseudomonas fluorescens TaxID=294 RepID=A0A5E7UF76_PSEFL|nr:MULTISPECIES: hypothetical protein [Pseudomonas]PBJ21362.1 hypothetical protein BSF44_36620 [Pseudomonas sp. ACN8]VVQ09015.1 hypothetical protein PS938_03363 [Pseudomonas fluorescens]